MNASVLTSAVQAANSGVASVIPAATPLAEEAAVAMSGMSKTTKIAIGAGAAGVVVVGGVVGYRMWRKKHPKNEGKGSNTQNPTPTTSKPLDEVDDFEEDDTEVDEDLIKSGEKLAAAREMLVEFVIKMTDKGFTDKDVLMTMGASMAESVLGMEVTYAFIQEAVDAGLAAAKTSDKDDEKK